MLVQDEAALVNEMYLYATLSEMGDGEEIAMEVRDVEDILEDNRLGGTISIHMGGQTADTCSEDRAVVAKDDFDGGN